jgi:hypothetical protein
MNWNWCMKGIGDLESKRKYLTVVGGILADLCGW